MTRRPSRKRLWTRRLLRLLAHGLWCLSGPLLALARGCMVLAGRLAGRAHDLDG